MRLTITISMMNVQLWWLVNSGLSSNAADPKVGGDEQTEIDSSSDDQTEMTMSQESKYSYNEAKALTHEIDEESEIFRSNGHDQIVTLPSCQATFH